MSERFESHVKGLTFKGLGVVSHPNGQVFFVRGVWPGDEGIFEVEILEKTYGYAKLIELTKKSEDRREAPCPHLGFESGKCGGCPWMIGTYSSQLVQKDHLLMHLLERASVLTDVTKIKPILGSKKEFSYRNRAQFKTDGKVLGYVSAQSSELAPIEDCIILTDKNRETLKNITSRLPNRDWEPKDKWNWNFIEIDESTSDVLLNKRTSFRQGNDEQNENMKKWLGELIQSLDKNQNVMELFCGSGNFTQVLSQAGFKNILATEMSETAVSELKSRNLLGVHAVREDIYKPHSWDKLKKLMAEPKILFLDPPREGFNEIHSFLKKFPSLEHVIYVSCDLSTYTNDVKKLRGQRFEIVEIQPVDQFPQTPHIEVLSYLKKMD